jgi:hypothetical protein
MLEKVCVLSRRNAQAWSPQLPTVAICISDVGSPPFQLSPAIRETLHLSFDDIASRFANQVQMTRQQELGGRKPVGAEVDAGAGLAQHAGKGGGLGKGHVGSGGARPAHHELTR